MNEVNIHVLIMTLQEDLLDAKIILCWCFVCLFVRLSSKTKRRNCGESNNVELYLASKPEQQPPLLAGNPQLFGGNKQTPSLKGMRSTTTMLTQGAKTTTTEGTRMKKTAGKVSCFKRESKVRAFLFSNHQLANKFLMTIDMFLFELTIWLAHRCNHRISI